MAEHAISAAAKSELSVKLLDGLLSGDAEFEAQAIGRTEEVRECLLAQLREETVETARRIVRLLLKRFQVARSFLHAAVTEELCARLCDTEADEQQHGACAHALVAVAVKTPGVFNSLRDHLVIDKLAAVLDAATTADTQVAVQRLMCHVVRGRDLEASPPNIGLLDCVLRRAKEFMEHDVQILALELTALLLRRDRRLALSAICGRLLEWLSHVFRAESTAGLCGRDNSRSAALLRNLTAVLPSNEGAFSFRAVSVDLQELPDCADAATRLRFKIRALDILDAVASHRMVRDALVATTLHQSWSVYFTDLLAADAATTAGQTAWKTRVVACLANLAETPEFGKEILRDRRLLAALEDNLHLVAIPDLDQGVLMYYVGRLANLLLTHVADTDRGMVDPLPELLQWIAEQESRAVSLLGQASPVGRRELEALFLKSRAVKELQQTLDSKRHQVHPTPPSLNTWHALGRPPVDIGLF